MAEIKKNLTTDKTTKLTEESKTIASNKISEKAINPPVAIPANARSGNIDGGTNTNAETPETNLEQPNDIVDLGRSNNNPNQTSTPNNSSETTQSSQKQNQDNSGKDKDKTENEKEGEKKENPEEVDPNVNPNEIQPGDSNEDRAQKIKDDKTGDPSKRNSFRDQAKQYRKEYDDLKKKYTTDGVKNAGRKAAKEIAKKAAKAAFEATKAYLSSALGAIAAYFGWPVLIPCLAIFLIFMLIFAGLICTATTGYFGKTYAEPAGPKDKNVLALIKATEEITSGPALLSGNIAGYHKLDFLNQRDYDYVKSGKIDKRLAEALNYIVQRHQHIRVSHIISDYENLKTDPESGTFHDIQITSNISAHKDGLAADIDEIDYVKDKCSCGKLIPAKVSWQSIGENPYGQAPDALNEIKSPDDMANDAVKDALKKMNVKGLDQEDLINKMKAIPVLAGISSPFDLTKSEVIEAFKSIGVTGLDDESLQAGLKRVQAIQALYDLPDTDMNAIADKDVQKLMNNAGIPINDEVVANIKKFKAMETLQSISSIEDLNNQDVKDALKTAGIDVADPNFQKMLTTLSIASNFTESGDGTMNQATLDGLKDFGLLDDSDTEKAKKIFQTAKNFYESSNYGMISDAEIINGLDQLAIDIGNPAAQEAVGKIKATYTILQPGANIADPEVQTALQNLNIPITDDSKIIINKFQISQQILDFQGDYSDPVFLSYVQDIGITLDDNSKTAISKYKASLVLADVANKKISVDSPEAKEALKTIGATKMSDPKAQSAVNIGNTKNTSDPKFDKDKQAIGIGQDSYTGTLNKLQAIKNLTSIYKNGDFNDPLIQQSLNNLGIQDSKYSEYITQLGAATKLLSIQDASDLADADFQVSLELIGIDDKKTFETLGKVGSLQSILTIRNVQDLGNPNVISALENLGVKDKAVIGNLGKIGSVYSLLDIHSVWDLTKPDVIQTLGDLNIVDAGLQGQLAQAGSVYTLTQIKDPMDLANPQSLQALDNLGIIDMDSTMLGQISAVQTLLNVRNPADLLNPNSILALNTLNIISLSNPVSAALMVVSFIDGLTGGKIVGAITGQCKGDTDCYKPSAQTNIHQVLGELLQFPIDKQDTNYYKITQIITFSQDRDVTPFDAKLDTLYGSDRPANIGLFAMPEAWDHLHIAY